MSQDQDSFMFQAPGDGAPGGGAPGPAPRPIFNLLTLEGGPSPTLNVRLLRYIEQACPGFLARARLFAGTSNGSFVALLLAALATDDHTHNLHVLDLSIQFCDDLLYALRSTCWNWLRLLSGLRPMNAAEPVAEVLQRYYGDRTLGDLTRDVVIVSYDNTTHGPGIIDTLDLRPEHAGLSLVDVALCSSALPLYLPIHLSQGKQHLDGVLVANNPAMSALTRAAAHLRAGSGAAGVAPLGDIVQLSLTGTEIGRPAGPPSLLSRLMAACATRGDSIGWGWLQWLLSNPTFLLDMVIQADGQELDAQARMLLGDRFHALAPPMRELASVIWLSYGGDPAKLIQKLNEHAVQLCSEPDGDVAKTVAWVQQCWFGAPAMSLGRRNPAAVDATVQP